MLDIITVLLSSWFLFLTQLTTEGNVAPDGNAKQEESAARKIENAEENPCIHASLKHPTFLDNSAKESKPKQN